VQDFAFVGGDVDDGEIGGGVARADGGRAASSTANSSVM